MQAKGYNLGVGARLTKAELAEAAKSLFADLVSGEDPQEIADVMGWDAETFATVQKAMLVSRAEEVRAKPADHVYIEYMIDQKRNINDLTDLINNLDKKRQYNAVVGSIRLRAELTDRILERGFDFGILKRAESGGGGLGQGNTFNIIAGVDVSAMTTPQLRDAITGQLNELHGHIEAFGDGVDITKLATGTLHYGDRAPDPNIIEAPAESEPEATAKKKKAKKKRSIA